MSDPRFHVACPLGDRTAGPEALALLVESIRKRGYEAFLIPMRNFRGRVPHPEYDVYDYRLAKSMPHSDRDHLILTEVSPIESFGELRRTPDENIWMLWLSVNNSPIPEARYFKADESCCSFLPPGGDPANLPSQLWPYDDSAITSGGARRIREAIRRKGSFTAQRARAIAIEAVSITYAERVVRRNINFGTQSYYGATFLKTHLGRESFMLTDYPRSASVASEPRDRNLVLYNGAKGRWKIPELIDRMPDVKFRPLQGMTYQEVCQTLSQAALYVELGHLPGRDRLPREAANYGTPTVMLGRGAGYCWSDFPIGERYRIPYTVDWADRMAPVIREVLNDPAAIEEAQAPFREWVAGEKARYEVALDAWMNQIADRG